MPAYRRECVAPAAASIVSVVRAELAVGYDCVRRALCSSTRSHGYRASRSLRPRTSKRSAGGYPPKESSTPTSPPLSLRDPLSAPITDITNIPMETDDPSGASARGWYSRPGAPWGRLGTTRPACGQTTCTSAGRTRPGATTEQDKALLLRPGGQGLAVIIFSGPSAKAAQRVRTGRYTRHVASAQRHTTAPPGTRTHGQSAFTQKRSPIQYRGVSGLRRALLRDGPTAGHEVVGHPKARYPLRRRDGIPASVPPVLRGLTPRVCH